MPDDDAPSVPSNLARSSTVGFCPLVGTGGDRMSMRGEG
jgi:hypothetical protein